MTAYLDNCATTRAYDEVLDIMQDIMRNEYANPSALHSFGFQAEKRIRHAGEIIAGILKAKPDEILFTSGATESNNLALFGGTKVTRRRGNHIISTKMEHPSVRKVLDYLAERRGYEVTFLDVDSNGEIDLEQLRRELKETTVMVTMMLVNNEIGTILPVNEAAAIVKEYNPKILFHCDAVQGFLKYDLDVELIDMISASAHKFHGPKGVGFLYKRHTIHLEPSILGGSQQNFMRAGTMNTEGIAGMGKAAELMWKNREEIGKHLRELKRYFLDQIALVPNIRLNGEPLRMAPHVCSVTFEGIRSEVLLHALEEKGVYVSAGSACSAHSKKVSSVLVNIGLTREQADSTLRFSFSDMNTKEEIDEAITALKEVVPMLRRFVRR